MSATRLHVAPARLIAGEIVVDGDDHHYLFRVRRLRPGDAIALFDGEGREADAEVISIEATTAVVRAGEPRVGGGRGCRIRIGVGLIKGDRMDWCVQKLTEVGADEIVVVQSARAVVRLEGDRAAARVLRYDGVARDAARQCRRATVPGIVFAPTFAEALARLADSELRLLAHTAAAGEDLRAALPAAAAAPPPASAALLVGPEGGFSGEEIDAATAAGWSIVGLGANTLRAETAAIVGAALLRFAISGGAGI